MPPDTNQWPEWSQYVLRELERQGKVQDEIRTEIQVIFIEVAKLKVRSGIFGVVGGALGALIPMVIAVGIWILRG